MHEKWVSLRMGLLHSECVMLNGRLLNGWHHFCRLYVALHTFTTFNPFSNKIGKFSRFYATFFRAVFLVYLLFHSIICGRSFKRIFCEREKKMKRFIDFVFDWRIWKISICRSAVTLIDWNVEHFFLSRLTTKQMEQQQLSTYAFFANDLLIHSKQAIISQYKSV